MKFYVLSQPFSSLDFGLYNIGSEMSWTIFLYYTWNAFLISDFSATAIWSIKFLNETPCRIITEDKDHVQKFLDAGIQDISTRY